MLRCYKALARLKLRRVFWLHCLKAALISATLLYLFHWRDLHLFSLMVFSNWYFSVRLDLEMKMELYEERTRVRGLPFGERIANAAFDAGFWQMDYKRFRVLRGLLWPCYGLFILFYRLLILLCPLLPMPYSAVLFWIFQGICAAGITALNAGTNAIILDGVQIYQEDHPLVDGAGIDFDFWEDANQEKD